MDLHRLKFTELQALFDRTFREWRENNFQLERVKSRELVKYSDFVKSRADLRQLARENAKIHNKLVQLDLEMQIRAWTGLND